MNLHDIEEIIEPICFRKMRVESGYLYNFYDLSRDEYQKEWVFVPDVTQQIVIGQTEKLKEVEIVPLNK